MQRKPYIAKATYDFATEGGAVLVHTPAINEVIPQGAIILRTWTDVVTAMTSGGAATVALDINCTTPVVIKAATAYNDAVYTDVDVHSTTATKTDSEGRITFTIADAALTAGKVHIFVEYIL